MEGLFTVLFWMFTWTHRRTHFVLWSSILRLFLLYWLLISK